ncbi:MAG: RNA polymerase sigma factor [Candidatus Paceibacterota bacterium]|jgi:RNA polymerase sigma-70 factor (ECF subfamily)
MRIFSQKSEFNKLAKRMKSGDEAAAAELYEKLSSKVFGFCMNRVKLKSEAEDLTQEIFLKLVFNIDQFDDKKGNFLVWFWQLSRNAVIDSYRKQKDLTFSDVANEDGEFDHPANVNVQESTERNMALAKVKDFIKSLKPEEQELFELRFVADLPYREIANLLKRPEGNLRVAANRLRQKIKELV